MKYKHLLQIYDMGENIFHIWEPAGVASSLVLGETSALLIDAGYGFWDLQETVEHITSLPYQIINTHCHLDHAGGNYRMNQPIGIHPYEREVYEYYQVVQKPLIVEKYLRERAQNEYLWQEGFDIEYYKYPKHSSFWFLKDGYEIDLGNRKLTVIFLPGHTKGSVVVFDEKTGTLFSGDNISDSLWIQFPQSEDVHIFAKNLDKLQIYPVTKIVSSHSVEPWEPRLIKDLQEAICRISLEESKIFVHPRTGVESRLYKYNLPKPYRNGKEIIYIVYDHNRL